MPLFMGCGYSVTGMLVTRKSRRRDDGNVIRFSVSATRDYSERCTQAKIIHTHLAKSDDTPAETVGGEHVCGVSRTVFTRCLTHGDRKGNDKAGERGESLTKQIARNSEFCRAISASAHLWRYVFSPPSEHLSTAYTPRRRYVCSPFLARTGRLITCQFIKTPSDHAFANTISRCRRSGGVSLL